MTDLLDIAGIAFRALERKDRIEAVVARLLPYIDMVKADKDLWPEIQALVFEIVPGAAPPGGYSVEWVQRSLNKLGEHLTVDGRKGKSTDAAIERFQAAHGIKVDGMAGIKTCSVLNALTTP